MHARPRNIIADSRCVLHIGAELWIGDDVLRIGDLKIITGKGTNSVTCMLGLGGAPVGLPLDPANLSTFCGRSTCSATETGADALICSECKCTSYSGVHSSLPSNGHDAQSGLTAAQLPWLPWTVKQENLVAGLSVFPSPKGCRPVVNGSWVPDSGPSSA